jgi:hypothetical protein
MGVRRAKAPQATAASKARQAEEAARVRLRSQEWDAFEARTTDVRARYRELSRWSDPVSIQVMRHSVWQFVEAAERPSTPFVLPPWQRPFVWTDDQVMAYHERLLTGGHGGVVVIWRRYTKAGQQAVVLDGQQRLTSVGVRMVRADGGAAPDLRRPVWDALAARWTWQSGPLRLTFAEACDWRTVDGLRDAALDGDVAALDTDEMRLLRCYSLEAMRRPEVVSVVIETSGDPAAQVRAALRAFLDLNRGGTPMDANTLAGLEAAAGGGDEW